MRCRAVYSDSSGQVQWFMLTVLCKSTLLWNAPAHGCESCVMLRETDCGLRGKILVVGIIKMALRNARCNNKDLDECL